jgi:hypothetical protein
VTLNQPTTLTVIYVPTDRPNQPSNVNGFTVQFVFPDSTVSPIFPSSLGGTAETTTTTTASGLPSQTTPSGLPSQTTTTPGLQQPSANSPRVDLPADYQVPPKTVIIVTITSTSDKSSPTGVRILLVFRFETRQRLVLKHVRLRTYRRDTLGSEHLLVKACKLNEKSRGESVYHCHFSVHLGDLGHRCLC